jgi:enoyl-CoA hydratase/carnithine racemase
MTILDGESGGVRAQLRDRVAIWTLARPARQNSLARETLQRLSELCAAARGEPELRALVLTGEGDRVFCAGVDLKERAGMSLAEVRAQLDQFRACFDAIDRLDRPVIAAIDGVALGGGLELALACDLRVMAAHAELALTETKLGIIPGAGGTQRLARAVGVARAKQFVLLAERVGAEEALRCGLVQRLAGPGERALELALVWARELANGAPIALAAALEALDAALDHELAEGLDLERACYERTLVSQDRNEGLDAFLHKRAPQFRGK